MKTSHTFILSFNKESYYVELSANSAFYAFVGDRFYERFDQFIHKQDLPELEKKVRDDDREPFPMRLIDGSGREIWCMARILGTTDEQCTLEINKFTDIIDLVALFQNNLQKCTYILEMYGDYYFNYDVNADRIGIYAVYKNLQEILNISSKEFEDRLLQDADLELQIRISSFMMTMRSGNGFNALIVKDNLISEHAKSQRILIKGASYETEDNRIYGCGYIHIIVDGEKNFDARLPEIDYLTGVLNKEEITKKAINKINTLKIPNTTIAIVDVDHFKAINDNYGHQKGDEVLKKVAKIIENEAGENSLTGRIGGDEFLVIFSDVNDMEKNREYLRGMKNAIHMEFPSLGQLPNITLSIGCASYPKDADNYTDLVTLADYALYLAKSKGKDRYVIYDDQKHDSLAEIQENGKKEGINLGRRDMSVSKAVCAIYDKLLYSNNYELSKLIEETLDYMNFDRIVVYAGKEMHIVGIAGDMAPGFDILQKNAQYLTNESYLEKFNDQGILIINNISFLENRIREVYEVLVSQRTLSAMQFRYADKKGNEFILSVESTNKITAWNQENLKYYRLIVKAISMYELI